MKKEVIPGSSYDQSAGKLQHEAQRVFPHFLPECIKLTAHLGSKIAFVTPINPGLYYWKCMVLYMHTIAAILIVKSLAEYLNT